MGLYKVGPRIKYKDSYFFWAEHFLDFSGDGFVVMKAYAGDVKKDNVLVLVHPSKPNKDFDDKSELVTILWGEPWQLEFKGDEFYLNGKIFDLKPNKFYLLDNGKALEPKTKKASASNK